MNFLILAALVHMARCGIVSEDHGIQHHERATSYQNIHIEHFHPVPTYVKKEDAHLLKHPIALGTSSSKVEVHHGDKHDHGYAFATSDNNIHGHGFEGFDGLTAGHEGVPQVNYQVHDQEDFSQYQGHVGDEGAAALGHYQLGSSVQGYPSAEAGHLQYDNHESR